MRLWIDPNYRTLFSSESIFEDMAKVEGEVFRTGKGRITLRFSQQGHYFFIKRHTGVGWVEIFKNLVQGSLPVVSAMNEWFALERLQILNISSLYPVACGQLGFNPAKQISFLVTRELTNAISLEDVARSWRVREDFITVKRAIIRQLARLVRRMHRGGINHRDMYICHIHVSKYWLKNPVGEPELFVIDLHRAQIRRHVPRRWLLKDIASLYFSSMNTGLTNNDLLRFMRIYSDTTLRHIFKHDGKFLSDIRYRAARLCERRPRQGRI